MKGVFICCFALVLWSSQLAAYTLLAMYEGGDDPTTVGQNLGTQWTRTSGATSVQGSMIDDNGTPVWRIYDPGLPAVSTSPASAANLYYSKNFDATTTQGNLEKGWMMLGVVRMPREEGVGVDWPSGSNNWIGYIHAQPNKPADRWLYGIQLGKLATGETKMTLYGSSFNLTLDNSYHMYSLVYDIEQQKALLYVDGVYQTAYSGAAVAGGGSGTSLMYWGDNASQATAQAERMGYYQTIQFYQSTSVVPEPSKMVLCLLGLGGLLWRRRR